ncbi:MAG: hypothetical protein WBX15_06040 [Thermoanaerobaculia bacterium]
MANRRNDETRDARELEFMEKTKEIDFDPWGEEDEEAPQRRRDPFRKPGQPLRQEDPDEEL